MGKSEMLRELWEARRSFLDSLQGLSETEASVPGSIGSWSVKGVVAHMEYWDVEFLQGLTTLRRGGYPEFLDVDCDERNAVEVEKRRGKSLSELIKSLGESGAKVREYLESLDEHEFSKSWGQEWKTWDVTIEWIAEGIIGHDRHHTTRILSWRRKERKET